MMAKPARERRLLFCSIIDMKVSYYTVEKFLVMNYVFSFAASDLVVM